MFFIKVIGGLFSFLIAWSSLYCMENHISNVPLASIYLLLNTADPGKGYKIFDADEHYVVFDSFVSLLLGKKKTTNNALFISYGLAACLKKEYEKSIAYFELLNIKDPLEQVAIQPVETATYHISRRKKNEIVIEKKLLPFTSITVANDGLVDRTNTMRTVFLKNPNDVAMLYSTPVTNDTYEAYVLGRNRDRSNEKECINRFKILLALVQGWRWHDTKKGLYCLTQNVSTGDDAFLPINQFERVDKPFDQENKVDTNEWIESLEDIFLMQNNYRYAYYFNAHGSQDGLEVDGLHYVLSMPEKTISKFFAYLNGQPTLDLVIIESCFVDGEKILNLARDYQQINTFNFAVVSATSKTAEAVSSPSIELQRYYPQWLAIFGCNEKMLTFDASLRTCIVKCHKKIIKDQQGISVMQLLCKKNKQLEHKPLLLLRGSSQQI